jgi:DNA-binding FadR family transcriptional regulator
MLLARYGVSRAVFREAVRLLEHHQIAGMRRGPGGGLVVMEPDMDSVTESVAIYLDYKEVDAQQLFAARSSVELRVIELATERIDEDGIKRVRQALDREAEIIESIRSSEEPYAGPYDEVIHEVHDILGELSGNEALRLFVKVLTGLTPMHAVPAYRERKNFVTITEQIHQAHVAIVDAVVLGDVGLARHRMSKHLDGMAHWLQ